MSNADIIRNMTDQQLASFLCYISGMTDDGCEECLAANLCSFHHNGMMDWVKQDHDKELEVYIR